MLQIEHSEVLWVGSCGVTRFFDAFHDKFCRERGEVMIERVVVQELTSHTACLRIRSMLNKRGGLFTENTGSEVLVGDSFSLKGMGWFGGISFFPSHCAGEFPKESCILSSVRGLHCSSQLLSV